MTTTKTLGHRVHPSWCTRGVRVNASRTPLLVHAWCTGERQPRTARICGHAKRSFTRTPGAYTRSDQGKRSGVRLPRTPPTQKPPLTRGNADRSPVHPYGADPKVSDHGPPGGRLVHAPDRHGELDLVHDQVNAARANNRHAATLTHLHGAA